MHMHPDDMKAIGVPNGSTVRVRSLWGEETFTCVEARLPSGMIFIPYGPPTCRLMGQYTDGTGMPLSKGWEVEVELIEPPSSDSVWSPRGMTMKRETNTVVDREQAIRYGILPEEQVRHWTEIRGRTIPAATDSRELPRPGAA
jgi:formylmethanofuran dehydrogenase subunit D